MPYERAAGGYMAARKASKKVINFCRGLDIRVSEVVYSDLLNTSSASARTFISFMRPDFVKEKILLYNLLILRITSILKIMLVIDNPYGSR